MKNNMKIEQNFIRRTKPTEYTKKTHTFSKITKP